MPCEFMVPGKGHEKAKKCNKPGENPCAEHTPKAPVAIATPPKLFWFASKGSGSTVNQKFQTQIDNNKTLIDRVCQSGSQTGGMPFKGNKGSFSLLHETQPGQNNTIFYNWTGFGMEVFAVGGHTGATNNVYSTTWFDGSSATINLKSKTIT